MSLMREKKNKDVIRGIVFYGINNIYAVKADGREWLCRIKGKVLKEDKRYYNPIAVGDIVFFLPDDHLDDRGWITRRENRKSFLVRWNKKKRAPQIIAANADVLVCLSSVDNPPFRPRFLDRLIISGVYGGLEPIVVINKIDLGVTDGMDGRVGDFKKAGYRVIYTSAKMGIGIEELKSVIFGHTVVFAGQSGVGKSSILNAICPDWDIKVGEISRKYNRGAHTTNFAKLYQLDESTALIDTPGIRELELYGIDPDELWHYFPEFLPFLEGCEYPSCKHISEPICGVKEAVANGKLSYERYESYVRLYDQLKEAKARDYERY